MKHNKNIEEIFRTRAYHKSNLNNLIKTEYLSQLIILVPLYIIIDI